MNRQWLVKLGRLRVVLQLILGRDARHCMILVGFELYNDNAISMCVGVPGVMFLSVGLRGGWARRLTGQLAGPRELGIRVFDGLLSVSIWNDPGRWSRDDPWWQCMVWHVADFFLGKRVYSSEVVCAYEDVVILDEGVYLAEITENLDSWRRRGGRGEALRRAHVRFPVGIPIPMANELYDVDEDRVLRGVYVLEDGVAAVDVIRARIVEYRQRYGGVNWVPR